MHITTNKHFQQLFFILLITGLFSCSITNRRYRRGYYIQNSDKANTKANPTVNNEAIKKNTYFTKSDIKEDISEIHYGIGLGAAYPLYLCPTQ